MTEPGPPSLLFGVPIDDVTMDEAVEAVAEMVRVGRLRGTSHQVATVNVDFLVHALAARDVRRILQRADLCIADGMPLLWGAKWAGMPLRERVAGADLVPALVSQAGRRGWRIHFFGSAEGVAEAAVSRLREQWPDARLSATSGPFLADPTQVDVAVLDEIAQLDADILCVALGNPKQERFIAAHRDRLRVPVMIGIGGTLDMLVGDRRRAPAWVQRAGLEWLVRAAQEPGRLGRRYAHDARVFFPALARHLWHDRDRRSGIGLACFDPADGLKLKVGGVVGSREGWARARSTITDGSTVWIDLGEGTSVPTAAAAQIIDLARAAGRAGAVVELRGRGACELLDELGLAAHISG